MAARRPEASHAGLRWPDVLLEPFLQGQVVRHAAQQGHGRVRVRVEEGGEDGRPFRRDDELRHGVGGGVEVGEAALADKDVGHAPLVPHAAQQGGLRDMEFIVQAAVVREDALGVAEEGAAAGGEPDAAAAALEELAAGIFLQLGDVLADSGLRNAQGFGCGSEAAELRDLGENTESEIFDHKLSLSLRKDSKNREIGPYSFTVRKALRSSALKCSM